MSSKEIEDDTVAAAAATADESDTVAEPVAAETDVESKVADTGSATTESDTPDDSPTVVVTAAATAEDSKSDQSASKAAAESSEKSTKKAAAEGKRSITLPRIPTLGRKSRIGVRVAAVAVLAASIASSVLFYQRDTHHKDLLDAQESAREAACKYAPVLVTYDAKNLDTYFTAVLAGATGDWHTQFDNTSKDLRDVLTQGEVVAKADDVQCAIRAGDQHSADAIVVIGQTITSLGTQGKPAPGQLSMVMHLERSGDRWLVSKLNSPLVQPRQS